MLPVLTALHVGAQTTTESKEERKENNFISTCPYKKYQENSSSDRMSGGSLLEKEDI